MLELLRSLLSSDYMPHGHCYLWEPALVGLEVATNLAIGLAYLSISLTLAYLAKRIEDLPFQWVYVAFGVFIVACGFTHFLDVWVVWRPNYWVDVWVRAVTAIASVGTAILLIPLIPKAIALGKAARIVHERGIELEHLNTELAALYEKTRAALAEAVPSLVWTATPEGVVDYLNQRWCEYTGTQKAQLNWADYLHPDDRQRVVLEWQSAVRTGRSYETELRFRRADGTYRWFLSRATALRSDDRILKWIGLSTDIHERKMLGEERERLLVRAQEDVRVRDVFLAIAAHELKTPLTPLRFEVEGLLRAVKAGRADRLTPERVGGRLSIVEQQLGRLERLVANLLDVSRITSGHFELHREDVDLGALVREIAERHAPELERAGCVLETRVAPSIRGRFDRLRLDEVITNLLMNAIAYGRGQPITIELSADTEKAHLAVEDHGIGIAPEDQERIFERFERGVSERHGGGLGLGLWLVRQVVQAHGGTVAVSSALGEGARFSVDLPLE